MKGYFSSNLRHEYILKLLNIYISPKSHNSNLSSSQIPTCWRSQDKTLWWSLCQSESGTKWKANCCGRSIHTFHSKTCLQGLGNNWSHNKREFDNFIKRWCLQSPVPTLRRAQTHRLSSHLARCDGAAFNGDASKTLISTLFSMSRGVVNTACGATNPQTVLSNGGILYFSSIPLQ